MTIQGRSEYLDRIADEAATWFARVQDPELTHAEREAFATWLAASGEHVREYLQVSALHADIAELPGAIDAHALIRAAGEASNDNVVALATRTARTRESVARPEAKRTRSWRRGSAVAAAIAAVALVLSIVRLPFGSGHYQTVTGQQQSFPLPDGSIVTLNAVSELRVRYSSAYRDVYLDSGEALFEVAKDAARPLRVITPRAVIRAVGTQFNVYHRRADTTVTVVEGTIEVTPKDEYAVGDGTGSREFSRITPVRVTHGQRARVEARSDRVAVVEADVDDDTAWRERRLVFESRPLGDAVAEFNLYNETRLVIADPAVRDIEVSGTFYANNPRSFALFLEEARLASTNAKGDWAIELRAHHSQ